MSVRKKVLQRGEKAINYQLVKKIQIVSGNRSSNSAIFAGVDMFGKNVHGKPGDEFNVPDDISRESATKLMIAGFAIPCDKDGNFEEAIPALSAYEKRKSERVATIRNEAKAIECIKIIGSGARTKKTAFQLGRDENGQSIVGKVGDVLRVPQDISEDLAKTLIAKKFAEKKK